MTEVGRLPSIRDEFNQDSGLDTGIVFALYEATSGAPPTAVDSAAYANQLLAHGWVETNDLPVLAAGTRSLATITPMTQNAHPELCAVTPELMIISCYNGHGTIHTALEDIRAHAAAAE